MGMAKVRTRARSRWAWLRLGSELGVGGQS